jgi:hypothetical protein
LPSCKKACGIELSDNLCVISLECKHCPVSPLRNVRQKEGKYKS